MQQSKVRMVIHEVTVSSCHQRRYSIPWKGWVYSIKFVVILGYIFNYWFSNAEKYPIEINLNYSGQEDTRECREWLEESKECITNGWIEVPQACLATSWLCHLAGCHWEERQGGLWIVLCRWTPHYWNALPWSIQWSIR